MWIFVKSDKLENQETILFREDLRPFCSWSKIYGFRAWRSFSRREVLISLLNGTGKHLLFSKFSTITERVLPYFEDS